MNKRHLAVLTCPYCHRERDYEILLFLGTNGWAKVMACPHCGRTGAYTLKEINERGEVVVLSNALLGR